MFYFCPYLYGWGYCKHHRHPSPEMPTWHVITQWSPILLVNLWITLSSDSLMTGCCYWLCIHPPIFHPLILVRVTILVSIVFISCCFLEKSCWGGCLQGCFNWFTTEGINWRGVHTWPPSLLAQQAYGQCVQQFSLAGGDIADSRAAVAPMSEPS